jgi:hypothetical protein
MQDAAISLIPTLRIPGALLPSQDPCGSIVPNPHRAGNESGFEYTRTEHRLAEYAGGAARKERCSAMANETAAERQGAR